MVPLSCAMLLDAALNLDQIFVSCTECLIVSPLCSALHIIRMALGSRKKRSPDGEPDGLAGGTQTFTA